ncbi:DUF21 domain-containing protein At5g52790-like isoform X2 [Lycium ferocissimum]|uniref:DUF21 domain-containing protein At5g52790-like isoform X2 n=1 Tax=Lycium ferocissimum TaxID=112874 RepID=UPI002814B485|nr:DUF21 domain-containing protein At5g52790-like isoform X2 [Lycium ferocissimum]
MAANDVPCCETMFWVYLVISVSLVCFAGLMSGLTLGLMSLSLMDLEVLIKAGQPNDRKNAEKILPIVKNQHLLLCTLLICNAMAMEALPIFLDALLPAWGAILISVTLILAFGEIIPQAICSRYGLSIGARLSPLVRLLVIVVFPLSYPISKLLDSLLGKGHSALLRRAELKTLVNMHGNEAGKGGELSHDETTIIAGALDLAQKMVKDAMTPMSRVFSLDLHSKLTDEKINLIISKGHSRVPVYSGSPTNIVGLILVKNLIKCRPEDEVLIKDLTIRSLPKVPDSLPLYDLLNQFQKGNSHMAVVVKSSRITEEVAENAAKHDIIKINILPDSPIQQHAVEKGEVAIGIITMEDVLEQLLQEPIYDETDDYVAVHNKSPGVALGATKPKRQSPITSPVSSAHQSPMLRSPVSPYVQSPYAMPKLSVNSPAHLNSTNSPSRFSLSSPSSNQVSRKSYGKLDKHGF